MQQPAGTTTTTEIWQWQCAVCRADWKMLRQVTTTSRCPREHGCRWCHGAPPLSAASPPLPSPHPHHHGRRHHHHHLHPEEGNGALAADEGSNAGRRKTTATLTNPAPPAAVAQACWVPDPYLMVQQLREFEPLDDEVVVLRAQLQEYAGEIERSIERGGDGTTSWFLALPAGVRDVLVMARDAVEAFVAVSAAAPTN